MAMIYVRTRPGRRAFYEGKVLPTDKFVPVADTPYIRRLINHHGDLEIQGEEAPKPTARAAPEREKRKETQPVEGTGTEATSYPSATPSNPTSS